jgi:hypothetical protein
MEGVVLGPRLGAAQPAFYLEALHMIRKRISEMTADERREMCALVDECAYSTPFHKVEWLLGLEEILGKEVYCLYECDAENKISFALPLIYKQGLIFPEMHSFSMAYDLVYGGPLMRSDAPPQHGFMEQLLSDNLKPAKSLVATLPPRFPTGICNEANLTHICNTPIFDLNPGIEELWNALPYKNVRCNINKACKCDVSIIPASSEHLTFFHQYLDQTLACFNKQALSQDYYGYIAKLPFSHTFSAMQNGLPIAVAIVLTHRDTVYYWGNASSYEHRNSRPNDLLVWEIMKWAKENGYKYFDFLITPLHSLEGVTRFKAKFGAAIHPIYQYQIKNLYQKIDRSLYYITHPKRILYSVYPFRRSTAK